MVSTIGKKRKRRSLIPGAIAPAQWRVEDWSHFSRAQIAEIFGDVDPSLISRYSKVLDVEAWVEIPREKIWGFYLIACWKHWNQYGWLKTFQDEWKAIGEEAFLKKYVNSIPVADSKYTHCCREHCEELIDNYIARQNTQKLIA